jgi:predicted PolB exonuclease-like 3'-5' exonuclease
MTPIVVDCETFPLDDVEQYLTPLPEVIKPDLGKITAAKNLVDPAKVAADIEKRQSIAMDDYEEAVMAREAKRLKMIDDCALDADLGRVVALGWMFASDTQARVVVCKNESEEKFALEQLWRDYTASYNPQLVTYGGLKFDLPLLMRRSLYLGLRFPKLNLDRYRTTHLDLKEHLSHNGILTWRSLKFYLNRFGLQNDDLTTGADIGALVKAGQWDEVTAHCRADVLGTKRLAMRLGLIPVTVNEPAVAEGAF